MLLYIYHVLVYVYNQAKVSDTFSKHCQGQMTQLLYKAYKRSFNLEIKKKTIWL